MQQDNKPLSDPLVIYFSEEASPASDESSSSSNRCVRKLTGNRCPHTWTGPIIVAKVKQQGHATLLDNTYADVQAKDFANIVDFFLAYGIQGLHF